MGIARIARFDTSERLRPDNTDQLAVRPAEEITEKASELFAAAVRYALEFCSSSSKANPRLLRSASVVCTCSPSALYSCNVIAVCSVGGATVAVASYPLRRSDNTERSSSNDCTRSQSRSTLPSASLCFWLSLSVSSLDRSGVHASLPGQYRQHQGERAFVILQTGKRVLDIVCFAHPS